MEWSLESLRSPWSEFHQAPSREPRKPLEAHALGERPADPLYEVRKRLRLEYLTRIAPAPAKVRSFLERHLPPGGTREARFLSLENVDEFLAFDAARRFALSNEVPIEIASSFELESAPDLPPHDSDWLRCSNFIIRRQTETSARRAGA